MKTTALVAVLLLTMTSVNAKTTVFAAKEGGSEGHGYTINAKAGEGVRPFKVAITHFGGSAGARGGITLEGDGASVGGFQQNGHETSEGGGSHVGGGFHVTLQSDGGGASSGGGFHDADEGGHTGNG